MKPLTSSHGGRALAAAAAGLLVGGLMSAGVAQAAPPTDIGKDKGSAMKGGHVPEHPLAIAKKKAAQKEAALERRLKGDKAMQGKVAKVGKGQYVELEREGTDRVFVVLAEFGDTRHSAYPDSGSDGTPQRYDGPMRNEIPAPDRSVDNSTLWQPDYDRAHYDDMYFNRMAKYFETQSSGRYSVDGDVAEWVKVPFNEARYGRDVCGGIVCNNTWFLIRDAMAIWTQQQLDAGMSMAEIQAYLKTFDVQDRYDFDGDGDFNEPDGYIDHFQIVHAGGDQAAGDPLYGSDAIWSHRWYANISPFGSGPDGGAPFGGTQIGSGGVSSGVSIPNNPTDVWVGDYTIQPENGGLGVFAHEYTHDLGLPDLYDTSGNTGGAENSTAFWTLMSSGANIGDGGPDGIGDNPTDLSAWELLTLGWLSPQGSKGPFYEVARAGSKSTHKLGPNVPATKSPQAVFTLLPDKMVPLELGAPADGATYFYSGSGNDLNSTMTHPVGAGTTLTAKVRYEIEEDWDYAFLEASTDGGASWQSVETNLSDSAGDQSGFNTSGTGMTGFVTDWTDLTATLPTGTDTVRFRYQTDGAAVESGFQVDAVRVGDVAYDDGWTFNGFRETTGSEEQAFFNAYVLENRQYDGYDKSLKTAYNFGFLDERPDWVESYPYQNGLLVWYWDESYSDNNVGEHPGAGLLLPVDAHPTFHHWPNGDLMRQRILSYDSTFGTEKTDAITLHNNSDAATIPSQKAVPTFDDTKTWWFDCDTHACTDSHQGRYQPGWTGVDVPKTGTTITVNGATTGSHLNITVAPK